LGFFENQDRARRNTARLVLLFAAAVAAVVLLANLLVAPVYVLSSEPGRAIPALQARGAAVLYALAPAWLYWTTSLAVLAAIALGSLEISVRLAQGEGQLASLLSGRRVARGSARDEERRLLNVVDEISIASGLAVPPVYVLGAEPGINAFAAGRSPNQAIVVLTRGALEQLSRDELQAVVAHEFSHILNGDIRVNVRAACALQGILFLSGIGRFMMRYYSGLGTEEGRRFFHLPFAVIGAGLFAIGSAGLLFARLIQSALAREREYLADACAVQYTRNADALCGALARIGTGQAGSRMLNWHADALGHMLFAANARAWLGPLLATHPPIEDRMRRANPHTAPEFYLERARRRGAAAAPETAGPADPVAAALAREREAPAVAPAQPATIAPKRLTDVAMLVATIGEPGPAHLQYASGLLAYLPASVREALGTAPGAQAVMLGLLLGEEATARGRQLRALEALGLAELARKSEVLAPLVRSLDRAYRLPLVALALPALRELDEAGRAAFLGAMRATIEADARLTLSEFVLDTILDWNLGPRSRRAGRVAFGDRKALAGDVALVLSLLAHAGGDAAKAPEAFAKGAQAAGMAGLELTPADALKLGRVTEALERLSQLAPLEKEPLLAACQAVVDADRNVRLGEHELVRAVSVALDCPMPPELGALDPRLLRK
jgi:Zn-dependent protease with chaperone function